MGYAIGCLLAIFVSLFAVWVGLDRDRAFYPTVLIVVASYYVLFAVMGGIVQVQIIEAGIMSLFLVVAVVGFKFNLWIVAAGLAGHGVFDFFHGHIVTNPGMPEWWPAFCLAYDVGAAVCLAWLLRRDRALPRVGFGA